MSNSAFSRKTVARLAKRGIRIVGQTMLADESGSFADADIGFVLDNNGEQQIRRFFEVMALAA